MTQHDTLEQLLRSTLRDGVDVAAPPWLEARVNAIPTTVPAPRRRAPRPWFSLRGRRALSVAVVVVAAIAALGIGLGLVTWRNVGTAPSAPPLPTTWSGPVRADAAAMGAATMEEDSTESETWSWDDAKDTAIPWVDITDVKAERGRWRIELSGWLDQDEAIPDGATIAHGMVVETNGDGVADYVLGIDRRVRGGPYHVWITDLAAGETQERTGPPYGDPFDFSHPGEQGPGGPIASPPTLSLFPVGFAHPDVFSNGVNRFYAWASVTVAGEVVAWDYAPDASWLSIAPSDRSPRPSVPVMEPEARVLIIPVQNVSGEPAELFVASDTQPMGSLVGTAVPSIVASGGSEDVTFTVPVGEGWAIFVNPGPGRGPLIIAQDVPADASGELPIAIGIDQGGSEYVSVPADIGPGWMGR